MYLSSETFVANSEFTTYELSTTKNVKVSLYNSPSKSRTQMYELQPPPGLVSGNTTLYISVFNILSLCQFFVQFPHEGLCLSSVHLVSPAPRTMPGTWQVLSPNEWRDLKQHT